MLPVMSDVEEPPEAPPPAPRIEEPRGRPKTAQAVTVALLVVTLVTAIFVLQNTDDASINFLIWSTTIPLASALLLAVALGGLLGFLVAYVRLVQFRHALRRAGRDAIGPAGGA